MKNIGISACLLGENVRYDGTNRFNKPLLDILKGHNLIPVCPELFGGLSIPHSPCEINNNKVIDSDGNDVTDKFNKGAAFALDRIRECDFVILKTKSPSCGYKQIYDGTFRNNLIEGNGIFTKMCLDNNIRIYTELDIDEIKKILA